MHTPVVYPLCIAYSYSQWGSDRYGLLPLDSTIGMSLVSIPMHDPRIFSLPIEDPKVIASGYDTIGRAYGRAQGDSPRVSGGATPT